MLSLKEMQALVTSARRPADNDALEAIISTQEDASLRCPSVEAHYYRFLYRLCQMVKPGLILELGTHTGISAACMAEGNPDSIVITVNCLQELWEHCRRDNVIYLHQDSLKDVFLPGRIDILFIDTNHNGTLFVEEFNKFTSFLAEDGVVFIDDISLNQAMREGWKTFNPEGWIKFELLVHGDAGFGALIRAKSPQEGK